MKKPLFILFLLQQLFVCSQNFKLVVKDSITKQNIPLVSIKYLESNTGTFTNGEGYAEIEETIRKIKVSCIGYNDKTVLLSQSDTILYLVPREEKLEEVLLFSNVDKEEVERMKSKRKITFKTNAQGFLFCRQFKFTEKSKILKIRADILNDSTKKNLLLKVYSGNEDGNPGKQVLYTHYYSVLEPFQKYVNLDLSEENLIFEKGDIFIALVITSDIKEKTELKFGINTSKKPDSYYKPYYAMENAWFELPNIKGKKHNNFNISILTDEID